MHVYNDTDIFNILEEIGMKEYKNVFKENMIRIQDVVELTEKDFEKLGVTAIGLQLRLKQACRNHLQAKSEDTSPVLKKFFDLKRERVRIQKTKKIKRHFKPTRRIYCGWKHAVRSDVFKVVTLSKGGGQQIIDVSKDTTYEVLEKQILDLYFPKARSMAQNLKLSDLNHYLASFSGDPLPRSFQNNHEFSVGNYFDHIKTYPVRVYLHTTKKDEDDDNYLPDISKSSPGPSKDMESQSLSLSSELEDPQLLPGTSRMFDAVCTDEGSDAEFENAGTPVIFFKKSTQTCLTSTPKPEKNGNKPFLSEDLDGDMQMQEAICASLEMMQQPQHFIDLDLRKWTMNTLKSEEEENVKQLIVVHRRHVLNSALRALDRASFKLEEPFKVEFPGELGADYGGPKREFLSCLMKELANAVLEGEPYNKTFIHSVPLLDKEMFFKAGRMIVWSILHGGPGFPFLNSTLYQLLIEPKDVVYSTDDVIDLDVKNKIQKLQTADEEELNLLSDWMVEQGVYGVVPPYTEQKRDCMARQLLKSHVYLRIHAEIAQFRKGLNTLEFYTIMKSNSEEVRGLFLHMLSNSMVTMQKIKEIIHINYSEDGSNDKRKEEDTMYAFELFLQDCSEDTSEINLNMLLAFWTGAETIPPLGFHKKLEIKFVEDPALLPVAHTCDLLLEISRGETPEEFHRKMELAITCGGEFHLA